MTILFQEKRSLLLPWIVSNSSKFVLSLAVVIFFIYSAKKVSDATHSKFMTWHVSRIHRIKNQKMKVICSEYV